MVEEEDSIWVVLGHDEHNIGESRKLLEVHGLMRLFEKVSRLLDALPREVEAELRESGRDPFAREIAPGDFEPAWDFILRTYMLQSAGMQFLHSLSHLLRGHSLELFGHARTMIENAGIAYLSKSEPDLGELYLFGRGDYRGRTVSSNILPADDPLTIPLKSAFDHASQVFHSNFISVASRIKTHFKVERGKRDFRNEMQFHDVNPDDHGPFLRHAQWLLSQGARVLRLFASAFSLPDCVWYRRLEAFEREVEETATRLRPLVTPRTGT